MSLLLRQLVMVLTVCAACSSTSVEPDAVTPADVNGVWRLELTKQQLCSTPSVMIGQLTLFFTEGGQADSANSVWNLANPVTQGVATGQLRFRDAVLELTLWEYPHISGIRLSGVFTNGRFSGAAQDPAPGYETVFSMSCNYSVQGTRQ